MFVIFQKMKGAEIGCEQYKMLRTKDVRLVFPRLPDFHLVRFIEIPD